MKIKYKKYIIENDVNNNVFLFSHKVSQWLKFNSQIKFGVYANLDSNNVEILSQEDFPMTMLSNFLDKKIEVIDESIEINEGDSLIIEMAFKNNHLNDLKDKNKIKLTELSASGYLPNHRFVDNKLCHFINGKEIVPLQCEMIVSNQLQSIKLDYIHETKQRRLSINKQTFLLRNCTSINFKELLDLYLYGLGVKKSYGLSRIVVAPI